MNHIFSTNMLEEGMIVADAIRDSKSNMVLLAEGTPLTKNYIDTLKRRGIEKVAVKLTDKEKTIYELDHNVISTVDPIIMQQAQDAINKIDGRKPLNEQTVRETIASAGRIVDSVLLASKFTYKLTDYRLHKEPSEHAVRVAVFSSVVAKKYNENLDNMMLPTEELKRRKINLQSITLAGMLHEVGRTCEDDEIRHAIKEYLYLGSKFPGLTKEKVAELKETYDPEFVPYYGYNIIQDNKELPSDAKVMLLLSGEDNISGPLKSYQTLKQLSSLDKHIYASKIINMCSMFDEALMENIKDEVTLENVFAVLEASISEKRFDRSLLELFTSAVPLYPEGTKVQLHGEINGYAVVKKNFTDVMNYTRPILLTVPDNRFVDLRRLTTTTVKNVVGDEVKFSKFYMEKILEQQEQQLNNAKETTDNSGDGRF